VPELPEVEINARNLRHWAGGRTIAQATAPPGTRETAGVAARAFEARLRGRRVEGVERLGKWILVRLSNGAGLGLHLGMTGKIAHAPPGAPLPRFTRAVFLLDDGQRVCFVDSRRFGKVVPVARFEELLAREEIASVGPDALSALRPNELAAGLAKTKRTVKEAIMDQRLLAGVGNLYAAEALWRSRIHPATPAPDVAADAARVRALCAAIRAALRQGLRTYGATELPAYIEEGGANPFHAYDRQGEPCHRCGAILEAMTLGGRTSAYCPTCQPAPRASGRKASSRAARRR
jgi:formamidopyrimidine-DNA glycosylase